jgi:hypothetical protein
LASAALWAWRPSSPSTAYQSKGGFLNGEWASSLICVSRFAWGSDAHVCNCEQTRSFSTEIIRPQIMAMWKCPSCESSIVHYLDPRPGQVYRCHRCSLELAVDPPGDRLVIVAPVEPRAPETLSVRTDQPVSHSLRFRRRPDRRQDQNAVTKAPVVERRSVAPS